jgi:phosphoribosylaminoimidazole (AIR) synthetase
MHHVVTFLFSTSMQQSSTNFFVLFLFLFFNVAWVKAGDDYLVAGTDGVGTKLKLAFETGIHDTIGIDLVCDHMLFAVLFMMCID